MRAGRFPLTYDECRERFRWAAAGAGSRVDARPISARGPYGQQLTIDVASLGARDPRRVLVVLGGVHGDEGFSSSVLQCDAISRWTSCDPTHAVAPVDDWPPDVGVVMIHAVNPWGMTMWRRQNENNVDLNRNWDRDGIDPAPNDRYAELHPALCPGPGAVPDADAFLARTSELSERHGYEWVKAAVTEGQYTHPQGLYFGGDRTEDSVTIVRAIAAELLCDATEVLVVDLHTGHGERGTYTLLSVAEPGNAENQWLRAAFDVERIEVTGTAGASSSPKLGQIATGLAEVAPGATWRTVTMELGTCSDTRMILAERAEHWVHFHGDRTVAEHARIVWDHRCCSSPDDVAWEASARAHGRTVLDASIRAVAR